MTCIVGIVENGKVYMGSDSQVSKGWLTQSLSAAMPKVFRKGDMLIGSCGSLRASNILKYSFSVPPHHPPEQDVLEYIAVTVVDKLRETFKDAGGAGTKDGVENTNESAFMIGYRGRLFEIGSDWSTFECADPFVAQGSGGDHALGALYAYWELIPIPQGTTSLLQGGAIVEMAIRAAIKFDMGCGGPIVVEELS